MLVRASKCACTANCVHSRARVTCLCLPCAQTAVGDKSCGGGARQTQDCAEGAEVHGDRTGRREGERREAALCDGRARPECPDGHGDCKGNDCKGNEAVVSEALEAVVSEALEALQSYLSSVLARDLCALGRKETGGGAGSKGTGVGDWCRGELRHRSLARLQQAAEQRDESNPFAAHACLLHAYLPLISSCRHSCVPNALAVCATSPPSSPPVLHMLRAVWLHDSPGLPCSCAPAGCDWRHHAVASLTRRRRPSAPDFWHVGCCAVQYSSS